MKTHDGLPHFTPCRLIIGESSKRPVAVIMEDQKCSNLFLFVALLLLSIRFFVIRRSYSVTIAGIQQ